MKKLNLEEALECAKNGEGIYAKFDDFDIENKYFTMDMLVDAIIEYNEECNIDLDVQGWFESICEYIEGEKDFKEWYDEEKDKYFNNMYDFFTKEYVEKYVEETIYLDYEYFDEEELQELYDEE